MDFETTAFIVIKRAYETYINVLMVLSCFLKGLKKDSIPVCLACVKAASIMI